MRELITLECPDCNNRNYSTSKNKSQHKDRLQLKKYCPYCVKHTLHKETK